MSLIDKVDTKKEAFKLVHDPTKLLNLLYLKYGDIEEEYYLSLINKLIYNAPSHYNSLYKELEFNISKGEYIKRFYKKKETKERIPILNDYYKNYHIFFCKPVISDLYLYELLHHHEELKAEIFYKNNYKDDLSKNESDKENNNNKNDNNDNNDNDTSSLSSLDNITDNKIIFDKRNKDIIDNDLDEKMYTISLNLDSVRNIIDNKKGDFGLISKRSTNDSFKKIVKNLVEYQINKNKRKKGKKTKEKKIKNKKNFVFKIYNGYYTNHGKKRKKIISQDSYKNIYNNINQIKKSLNVISRKTLSHKNTNTKKKQYKSKIKSHSNKNIFFSIKTEKNIFYKVPSKFEELSNKEINIKINDHKMSKTMNLISPKISHDKSHNNTTTNPNKNQVYHFNNNFFNINTGGHITNYKNFYKMSEILNFNKSKNNMNASSHKIFNALQLQKNNKKISYNNINKKNLNEFLTLNGENLNEKILNNNKKIKNKTFDFNNTNKEKKNINNIFEVNNINNNRTIHMAKNNKNINVYGGSRFNLVKGNLNILNNYNKNKNGYLPNKDKKNLQNKFSNYSTNYNHYNNNNNVNDKNIKKKSIIPKFNIIYSNGEVNISNNKNENNAFKDNNKLIYLSNNNSIINENKRNINNNQKVINKNNNVSYTNNNFNINFNNVFFCSQRITPGIADNINYNSENNNIKSHINNKNNTTQNYNSISSNSNNTTMNKVTNNIYIKNLKSIYNISRNKQNVKGSSLTQNQTGNKAHSKKNSKEKIIYNLNNNYNIPSTKKKYIIKEKNLNNNNHKQNEQKIANISNKNIKSNKIYCKEDFNIQNSNKIKYSNIVSIRGKSKNVGKSYKNINLTSKNNTKSKHKKKISNLI